MDPVYITTTLPYVNAPPHLGFAYEAIRADVWARHHRLLGKEVFFNTGTDEHGLKIFRQAVEQKKDTRQFVDEQAAVFFQLQNLLNLSNTRFIRTTEHNHLKAAQEFWRRCAKDITKKKYKIKYCVGCEMEKTDSELDQEGYCPIHPGQAMEEIEEKNYFFNFSSYQEKLLDLYDHGTDFVLPATRLKEIRNFVARGLDDFSISRLKSKMPWGIPVPGDDEHVIYVWFDALINYVSTLGWPENQANFQKYWPAVQIAGKDNLRQQSAMWQAMLMSAGLPTSKQIVIHGFITNSGEKMSKSLGNTVSPESLINEYGTDALRYWVIREASDFEDSDYSDIKFKEVYNANLANGLGNLVSRIHRMFFQYEVGSLMNLRQRKYSQLVYDNDSVGDTSIGVYIESFQYGKASDIIWGKVKSLEGEIQENQPYKKIINNRDEAIRDLKGITEELFDIAVLLEPLMPETSTKILQSFKNQNHLKPLFPRKL